MHYILFIFSCNALNTMLSKAYADSSQSAIEFWS